MGFALERQTEEMQEHRVKGTYLKAAVSCWFTSQGKSMPQLVKYEDEDGMIQCIKNIHLIKTEEKHYAGIRMRRYDCSAEDHGIIKNFILLYHVEDGTWSLVSNSGN